MAKRSPKVQQRWEEASAEIQRAKETEPEDTRFSWERAEDEANLPSYETLVPEDIRGSKYIVETAPTRKSERPRAYTIAYNSDSKSLIIIFRTGACCKYENISTDLWLALKNGESTNDFVDGVLKGRAYSYCDRSELSEETNARIDYTTQKAGRIQKGRSIS